MAADQIELRTTTFTKGHGWLDSYGTLLRDNDILLGRGRWTTGETVLAQVDCQPGAWQIQPGDRILRHWRLDGTVTADDAARLLLSTPIRGTWHSDDNSGATPPLDNRVVKGDSCQVDTGSGDSYVLHYDGSRFRGYGVLAEYRTAATSGAKSQHSDRVTWRAASWNGSASKYREMRARTYVTSPADASDTYEWRLSRFPESGSERDVLRMRSTGSLYVQGAGSGAAGTIVLSTDLDGSGGDTQFGAITCASGDVDQASCVFVHGTATRRALWRFKNPTNGYTGTAALAISMLPYEPATALLTTVNSPSFAWQGNYWNGAASVDSFFYSQYIVSATTPAGYLEIGSTIGSGVYQFHHDGLLGIAGSSTGGILLSRYTAASGGDTTIDSSRATWRGSYYDGSALDADFYAQHYLDTADPTGRLRISSSYGVGLWDFASDGSLILQPTTPANDDVSSPQKIVDSTNLVLRGHSWSGAASVDRDMRIRCFVASSADEGDVWAMLYDNGTTDAGGVLMDGTRMVGDAAANVLSFTLGAGTHPAVSATDYTGNAVVASLLVDLNGTIVAIPCNSLT